MRPVFWMGVLVLAGCWEQPSVYRYVAPKNKTDTSHRLLGAITRSATGTWFFKASGPAEKIGPIEKDFRKPSLRVRRLQAHRLDAAGRLVPGAR